LQRITSKDNLVQSVNPVPAEIERSVTESPFERRPQNPDNGTAAEQCQLQMARAQLKRPGGSLMLVKALPSLLDRKEPGARDDGVKASSTFIDRTP
jgi:hypothetical protein